MTLQNQPETPQHELHSEEVRPYTFNDLTTYLFRIMEEFRMNNVGFDRAKNESRIGPDGKVIFCLAYEKPAVRVSLYLDKEHLIVRLRPRSAKGVNLGEVSIACAADRSYWNARAAIFTSEPKLRTTFFEIVQRFGLFQLDTVDIIGRDHVHMSEQQAMDAIMIMIEVFKGAGREASS